MILPSDFYDRDSRHVAVDLLGCILTHASPEGCTSGVIVETEAYRQEDPACHAYRGPTLRNSMLFGPPGRAYVYLSYGVHALLNAVCEQEGVGSAVLIRALRPLEGQALMRERRNGSPRLCDGPGRLTEALCIPVSYNGESLVNGPVIISWSDIGENEIVATTRIGISRGADLPWRYLLEGERNVSVPPAVVVERGLRRAWDLSRT